MNIHYYRSGGDKPALILSHGAGDDGLCWLPVARELSHDYDIICPDARGHGLSDSGAGDYSLESRTADLIAFIKALGIEKAVFGGHSMGADVSIQAAIHHPQFVRALILEDPVFLLPGEPPFGGSTGRIFEQTKRLAGGMLRVLTCLPSSFGVIFTRLINPQFTKEASILWFNSKIRLSPDFLAKMPRMMDISHSSYQQFTQVSSQTLIFVGDRRRGAIVSLEALEQACCQMPNIQIVHVPGANHNIRHRDFPLYKRSVQRFLTAID